MFLPDKIKVLIIIIIITQNYITATDINRSEQIQVKFIPVLQNILILIFVYVFLLLSTYS
jgi:hypothetical protein